MLALDVFPRAGCRGSRAASARICRAYHRRAFALSAQCGPERMDPVAWR